MSEMNSKKIKTNKTHPENNSSIYIKIDSKNKLEGQTDDSLNRMLMESVNSIVVENIGKEINKFFIKILPENKEADPLKFNYALSTKISKKYNLNKIQLKAKCEEYMNYLINLKFEPNMPLSLNKDINEKLAFVLMVIFKNIKKYGKFSDYEEVKQSIIKFAKYQNGILDNLQSKNDVNPYSYMYSNDSYIDDNEIFDTCKKTTSEFNLDYNLDLAPRMSHAINPQKKEIMNLNDNNNMYTYKDQKLKSGGNIPLELFILREKFENIKIIKLNLKNNNTINNDLLLDQNDIIYNIFILINLKLIFQNLMGVELDLSNEIILKDQILDVNPKYEKLLKKTKKNRKITFYKSENKIRIYDVYKNKYPFSANKNTTDDLESSDNFSSFLMGNTNIIPEDNKKLHEKFLSKHVYSLQMIVIYWYFISKLNDLKIYNFTIPMNYEDKILLLLKESKIISFDFNIFANLTEKLNEITLDFNSLDNKLFLQILSFLFINSQLTKCHLSFFPTEEYFEPRNLFYVLYQSLKTKINKNEVNSSEEIDTFILRKLSENFEVNINKLFCYFINSPKLKEISLILDMPFILQKVDNYEIMLIKFIINIFLFINKFQKSYNKITIISDNLNFDNRKYPFLSDLLDNISIYQAEENKIESLTLKFKIYDIYNIYRIIPYNVTHLSLGSFDLISFRYFVEFITSAEFSIHSQIKYIQITLSNSILIMDETIAESLEQLLIYYPKNLEEICINTSIYTNSAQMENLIKNTNYNKIRKIVIKYNNSEDKMYKTPNKNEIIEESSIESGMDLYYIKKDDENYEKNKNKILSMMYKLGEKFNKKFMDFSIFSQLEKFLCNKGKKTIIFQ